DPVTVPTVINSDPSYPDLSCPSGTCPARPAPGSHPDSAGSDSKSRPVAPAESSAGSVESRNTQSSSPSPAPKAQPAERAHVTVKLPGDAQLWFEDKPTKAVGPVRNFQTPPLTPGHTYEYEVRARWTENGQQTTQTQTVKVAPGGQVNL